jgi:RNA polymerase sigma-70 factor, ECF subfamily
VITIVAIGNLCWRKCGFIVTLELPIAILPPRSPSRFRYGTELGTAMSSRQRETRLRLIVDEHLDMVARVLRNAGVTDAQLDDEIQRTLITVARRLDDIRPGAEKSFLIQIALRVAAHARRTMARRREVDTEEVPDFVDVERSPEQLTDQKHMRQLLDWVIAKMDEDLRLVFAFYEFEEMSMLDISSLLSIPQGTVASRLRRARTQFRELVAALELRRASKVGS